HPLTAEALLAGLTPAERAELSGRAADAVTTLHPDLPGDWCQLVASLRLAAGDTALAGQLMAVAGRRALDHGAPGWAGALLEHACRLLAGHPDPLPRAQALEALLVASRETGQIERALRHTATVDELAAAGLPAQRRAALHVGLARVAEMAA